MKPLERSLRRDSKLAGRLTEAAAMYVAGFSTVQVAAHYGLAPSNVYRQFKAHGIPLRDKAAALRAAFATGRLKPQRGPENHAWRGGRKRHSLGYVLLYFPGHRRASRRGYVYEHILVAEYALGRPLKPGEVVHHLNERKDDNRPENLQVLSQREHRQLHARQCGGRIGVNRTRHAFSRTTQEVKP